MSKHSVTEVSRHFSEFVDRVAFRGERFTLLRGGRAVAELGPVPAGRRLGELPALLAELPRLTPEEAGAFEADLEEARALLSEREVRDPWQSC